MRSHFTKRDFFWLLAVLGLVLAWFQAARSTAEAIRYSTAREGSWTIAVGELPLQEQDALRKTQEAAFRRLYYGE